MNATIAPVWITTDNKTNKRLKELFEMAKNLISNSYGVINSGEKIEIGDTPDTDTYKVFDEMIKRINSEVSKAILGQDATTTNKDSKGTYGSLKVMQEVANDRYESDKLFVENIINKQLLPKLAQLSSVYAPLANAVFDWDESEQIDNATYLDRVIRLKQAGFEIDPSELSERTGIPITGTAQEPANPDDDGTKKKKPELKPTAHIHRYYAEWIDSKTDFEPVAIDIGKYTKTLLKIAKEGFKNGFKNSFNAELTSHIFDDLTDAAEIGYGENWIKFDPHHSPTVKLLQKNLYFFAAGKSMAQLKEMNALLVDESGKIRNWNDFKKEVLKLNKQYNLRYLQAEYQTAKASAQSARKWNKAQKVKHLYPNLEYRTVLDDRVREEHAKLHGVIRPIDDSFWDTHYPPNGWRCRCTTRSSDKEPTPKDKIPNVPVHKHFRHNVGKTGQIFDEKQHPYFKYTFGCNDTGIKAEIKCKYAIDAKSELGKQIEQYKLDNPHYQKVYTGKAGGTVYISMFADVRNKQLFIDDVKALMLIADHYKFKMHVRPYVIMDKKSNPEYLINNLIGDRKTPDKKTFSNILKSANDQDCKIVVVELKKIKKFRTIDLAKKEILKKLKNPKHYKSIDEVILISKDEKEVTHFKRIKATRK